MKKLLLVPVLAGGIFALLTSEASAATVTYTTSATFSLDSSMVGPPPTSVTLPQYDPANFGGYPLRSIRLETTGTTAGSYTLQNNGGPISFDSLTVGSRMQITAPSSPSVVLNPIPANTFNNFVVNTNALLSLPLSGQDSQASNISNSDFNLYQGTGFVNFPISAFLVIGSDASLSPPINSSQNILLSAVATVSITYQNESPTAGIPEPDFGLISVAFCGLVGLALRGFRRGGDE